MIEYEDAVLDYDNVDWGNAGYYNVTEDLAFKVGIPRQEFYYN